MMNVLERCGLSEITTQSWTLEEDAQAFAAAGFGVIGVWAHKLEKPRIDAFWVPSEPIPFAVAKQARSAIDAAGLRVSHVILGGFFTGPGTMQERIDHTIHLVEITEALGCDCLVIAPGRRNGRTYDETELLAARALSEVLERSPHEGVRLALEPIVPELSDYMNTLGEAQRLAELVDNPRLGLWVDTYHLWRTGTLEADIERAQGRILGVHLDDWDPASPLERQLPGEGSVPLAALVRLLEGTGYTGSYDCEFSYDQALIEADPVQWAPEAVVQRAARAMAAVLEEGLA